MEKFKYLKKSPRFHVKHFETDCSVFVCSSYKHMYPVAAGHAWRPILVNMNNNNLLWKMRHSEEEWLQIVTIYLFFSFHMAAYISTSMYICLRIHTCIVNFQHMYVCTYAYIIVEIFSRWKIITISLVVVVA